MPSSMTDSSVVLAQGRGLGRSIVDTIRINYYTCGDARLTMAPVPDLYLISMAARMLGMHPQTLRKYERLGLVQPSRTLGSMRVYTRDELERLRLIKHLVDDLGLNLAGVELGLKLAGILGQMEDAIERHQAAPDLVKRLRQSLDQAADLLGLSQPEDEPEPPPVQRSIRIRHYVRTEASRGAPRNERQP